MAKKKHLVAHKTASKPKAKPKKSAGTSQPPAGHLTAFLAAPGAAAARVRKSEAALSATERANFQDAVLKAIASGAFSKLVQIHAQMSHHMHSRMGSMWDAKGIQRFLSWHRDYLMKMEDELRSFHPELTIPYWDWTAHPAVPPWLAGFKPKGIVNAAGKPIPVTRAPGKDAASLPTKSEIATILQIADYRTFTLSLEGWLPDDGAAHAHNLVHVWVGGTMEQVPTAPADPLFWLHHAQIDRLWSQWQAAHPGVGPTLSGPAAVLDPWPEHATDVTSTAALGYTYG